MKETTILHLSDLHFGRWFQQHKWEEIKSETIKIRPDVIIVTGDLVNTPWRWKLRDAKNELQGLLGGIKRLEGKEKSELFVIPGNHDTRISGLFAIKWLKFSFLVSFLVALMLFSVCHLSGLSWMKVAGYSWLSLPGILAVIFLLVALASAVLRSLTTTNLNVALAPLFLDEVRALPEFGLGILPFDSASAGKFGAHGRVPNDVTIKCQHAETINGTMGASPLFWIAAVHHHALPLPYDSQHESLMIMENAGTLLQELIKRRVPLILHGHKHHHHFARLLTRTKEGEDREIAVLSAATPTEHYNQGAFHHGYNVLRLRDDHELQILTFEAEPGSSFSQKSAINITSEVEYARRRFEIGTKSKGLNCAKMVSSAEIDEYGDVSLSREFTGLTTDRNLTAFPYEFESQSDSGEITYVAGHITSENSPGAEVEVTYASPHLAKCRVKFTGDILRPSGRPLDFHFRALATNAFALTSSQYAMMYPAEKINVEHMVYAVPDCLAVRELVLQLRFPRVTPLPKSVVLQVSQSTGSTVDEWQPVKSDCVTYMHTTRSVIARIDAPQSGSKYRFYWHVQDTPSSLSGKLENRLNKLDEKRDAQLVGRIIQEIFDHAVTSLASQSLASDGRLADICVTLYRFDRTTAALNPFGTSGQSSHPPGSYSYGAGLPGRAFKTGKTTVFDRDSVRSGREAEDGNNGRGVSIRDIISRQNFADTVDEPRKSEIRPGDPTSEVGTAIAVPIFDRASAHREPFCIVEVSVDGEGGQLKLADTYDDRAHSDFQHNVFHTLQTALPANIMNPNRKGTSHVNRRR